MRPFQDKLLNLRLGRASLVSTARSYPAETSEFQFPGQITPSIQLYARTTKWSEEFQYRFRRPRLRIKFIAGHNNRYRTAMPCNRLGPVFPRLIDDTAELILCILEGPRFHLEIICAANSG